LFDAIAEQWGIESVKKYFILTDKKQ